jgi:WD40 repeat protein
MKRWVAGLLLIGIAGCSGGCSPPGGGAVLTPESSQAKVDNPPAHTAAEQKAAAKNSVEGQETLTLKGHSDWVLRVSFSPDGKRIVSGSGDKTLKVWDAQTGQETLTLKGHSDAVVSVTFSPDGKRIVSSDGLFLMKFGEIKVWDLSPLDELQRNKVTVAQRKGARAAGKPAAKKAAAIQEAERLAAETSLTLKGHSGPVTSVSFSPDGKRIVSGSRDSSLKVWDIWSLDTSK